MKVACFGSQSINHQESMGLNWNLNTLNFPITSAFKFPCHKTMNSPLNSIYFRRKTRQTQPSKWKHRQINTSTLSNSQLAAKHSQSRLIRQMPKIWSQMRRLSQISTSKKPYTKIIKKSSIEFAHPNQLQLIQTSLSVKTTQKTIFRLPPKLKNHKAAWNRCH